MYHIGTINTNKLIKIDITNITRAYNASTYFIIITVTVQ